MELNNCKERGKWEDSSAGEMWKHGGGPEENGILRSGWGGQGKVMKGRT